MHQELGSAQRQPAFPGKVAASIGAMRPMIGNETGRSNALSSIDWMERATVPNPDHTPKAEDDIEQAFPGCALTHVLTITSNDQLSVAIDALRAVRASGADIESLHLSRLPSALEHRLKIVGLRPRQARNLAETLAAQPGIERASVEHQFLRI
jgi:hypothetical protein